MKYLVLTAIFLGLFSSGAEARQRRAIQPICDNRDVMRPCPYQPDFLAGVRSIRVTMKRETPVRKVKASIRRLKVDPIPNRHVASVPAQVIGGRPEGCPHAFCGCGASLHLFGKIIPSLNLAANWLGFPRAAPAPRMVAARRGHVMVLEQHISGNIWLVHDSNSGSHLTRLHARSIAGYAIVDPRGAG